MKTNEKHEKLFKHETNWKKWKNEKAWQEMISNGKIKYEMKRNETMDTYKHMERIGKKWAESKNNTNHEWKQQKTSCTHTMKDKHVMYWMPP